MVPPQLKIISFNCSGVSSKLPIIRDLCEGNHIVLLQETWLMPHNLGILCNVHKDFDVYSISAVDCTQALVGRPYGGLSILWRKDLSNCCDIVSFDDARLLGLDINHSGNSLHILNVYLPYFAPENYDGYLDYIGKISSHIEYRNVSDVMVFGDFNADVGGVFYREWVAICQDYDMVFADVA